MKKLLHLIIVLTTLASCSSVRKSASSPPAASTVNENKNPRFIENISIPSSQQAITYSESKESYHPASYKPEAIKPNVDNLAIESANSLQIKYAILLNLPIESTLNLHMLEFIEEWYGAPYRYGGTSKKGVDCSAFVNFFMAAVYGVTVPRNSKEQYSVSKKIKKKQLEEGDLIFFNTRGGISHVGVYLANNKFVHASTSSGVTISDLDENYFSKRYIASGRVK